jgi:hypothetical protein
MIPSAIGERTSFMVQQNSTADGRMPDIGA